MGYSLSGIVWRKKDRKCVDNRYHNHCQSGFCVFIDRSLMNGQNLNLRRHCNWFSCCSSLVMVGVILYTTIFFVSGGITIFTIYTIIAYCLVCVFLLFWKEQLSVSKLTSMNSLFLFSYISICSICFQVFLFLNWFTLQ